MYVLCAYILRMHKRKKRISQTHTHTKARLQLRKALSNTAHSLLHIHKFLRMNELTYQGWCDTKRRQVSRLQPKTPDTCHTTYTPESRCYWKLLHLCRRKVSQKCNAL